MLEHRGRHSGLRRRTVLEVVARGDQIIYVAAAWGRKAEWLKNIKSDPHVIVHSGGDRYESDAAVIAPEEAQVVLQDYARRHPRALRGLARFMLGKAGPTLDETVDSIATTVPMVALPRSR